MIKHRTSREKNLSKYIYGKIYINKLIWRSGLRFCDQQVGWSRISDTSKM